MTGLIITQQTAIKKFFIRK